MSVRVSGKSRRLLVMNLSAPAMRAVARCRVCRAQPVGGGQRGRHFGGDRVDHPQAPAD